MSSSLEAHVGMPATISFGSDRHACTVVWVSENGGKIVLREDTATRVDSNGISDDQTYEYTPNPEGREHILFRGKSGYSRRGQRVHLGERVTWHDYSF